MTAFDRFDPFERRTIQAIDEIAAARPPTYLGDILQQTARSTQRPRWTFLENWLKVDRAFARHISLIAAVVLIGVALLAGVYILSSGRPTPVPTHAATPAPSHIAGTPSVPAAMWGDWLADAPPIDGLPNQGPRIHEVFSWDNGVDFWIETNYNGVGPQVALSTAWTTAPDEIRLAASSLGSEGCAPGDEGWYRWQRSVDGLYLTLSLVEDACTLRATTLARMWVHSFAAVSDGGRGVSNAVSPAILMTLPSRRFAMAGPDDAYEILTADEGAQISFVSIVNPLGYPAPCASPPTDRFPIGKTADAFVAYITALPGHTVKTTETQIDGRRAVHLEITTAASTDCPSATVAQFAAQTAVSGKGIVSIAVGDPESLWAVEVGTDLFVLYYAASGPSPIRISPADEQRVIDSISFIDELPTGP